MREEETGPCELPVQGTEEGTGPCLREIPRFFMMKMMMVKNIMSAFEMMVQMIEQ